MLNDKALCRLMRRTFKGGGVKVCQTAEKLFCLDGGYWAAQMPRETVPGTVLAVVAEWLRRLPEPGEGWHCLRDVPPEEFERTAAFAPDVLYSSDQVRAGLLKLAPLTWRTARMAVTEDNVVVWFEAGVTDVLGDLASKGGGELLVLLDGSTWGHWTDAETRAQIALMADDRGVPPRLTVHLSACGFWREAAS